ncbi:MAG: DUF2807 domain-containing protein [Bacteroidetes bacterium]|uniref:DUF2807 domain-containing protein n=1 Tax=Candidatus Gallipaludibacter merdavium TaxID=2840839 RepID=A0A9D9HSJ6_9BACT|nr:DUF2807 domain-containing protein [Candidatus Gallipaludibacter merdavium]
MKQTLTVNLNGIAFHIDQDAYQKLNDYLTQVRAHLNVNDDKDEIIADIEARIGEVFTEKLRQKRQEVVNMEMVQEIIDMLGQPTDYSDEASEEQAEPENKKHKKRFYRDEENGMIGGVAAGLAAYLGWDMVWVRLGMALFCGLLLFFSFQVWPIFIYLLVWLIAPAAKSTAQKLEMRGEKVTIDNIASQVEKNTEENKAAKTISKVAGVIAKIIFFCIIGFFGLIGLIVLFTVGIALLATLFGLGSAGMGLGIAGMALPFEWNWAAFGVAPWQITVITVSGILLVICPIIIIIGGLISLISKRKWTSKSFNISFLVVWFIALSALTFSCFYSSGIREVGKQILKGSDNIEETIEEIIEDSCYTPTGNANCTANITPVSFGQVNCADPYKNTEGQIIKTDLPAFNHIRLKGPIQLTLQQNQNRIVTVSHYDKEPIITVKNGTLYIENTSVDQDESLFQWLKSNKDIKAVVVTLSTDLHQIDRIEASKASDILIADTLYSPQLYMELNGASQLKGAICAELFKIEASGASNIESYIEANEVDFEVSGVSNMNLKGKAGKVNYEASGASNISAKNLHANACTIECSGASAAEIYASESLDIDVSGMSHVSYSGQPKQLNENSSGMSVIERE